MAHDVSSLFLNEISKQMSHPIRYFTIGTSDYSDHVIKWPKFKKEWNSIRPVNLLIDLANEDQQFNFIRDDTTLMTSEASFQLGFFSSNLVKSSEQFDNTTIWRTSGVITVTPDTDVSPDGTINADIIDDTGTVFNGDLSNSPIAGKVAIDNTKFYHVSVHIKKDSTPRTTRFMQFTGMFIDGTIGNKQRSIYFDTMTGEHKFPNFNTATPGEFSIDDLGTYWRIGFSLKDPIADFTNLKILITPAAGASDTWVSSVVTGSVVAWGAQIVEGTSKQDYIQTTTVGITNDDRINLFTGKMERVNYVKGRCAITFVDKFKQLTERVIGSSDNPVTYISSNYLPADIAWYAITSYGGYDTTASSANVDIDYESWLEWSNVFSADAVLMNAEFKGLKVGEVLRKIGRQTNSAIFIHDNKIRFKRFSISDSNQTFLDDDTNTDVSLVIDNRDVTNKVYVSAQYSTTSDYWQTTVNDIDNVSVSSYGLKESTIEDKNIWYSNSASAINLAQRITAAFGVPYDKLKVSTALNGIARIIGETVSLTDNLIGVSGGYRVMGQTIDMELGKVTFNADRSYFSAGFILDTSTLGSTATLT